MTTATTPVWITVYNPTKLHVLIGEWLRQLLLCCRKQCRDLRRLGLHVRWGVRRSFFSVLVNILPRGNLFWWFMGYALIQGTFSSSSEYFNIEKFMNRFWTKSSISSQILVLVNAATIYINFSYCVFWIFVRYSTIFFTTVKPLKSLKSRKNIRHYSFR